MTTVIAMGAVMVGIATLVGLQVRTRSGDLPQSRAVRITMWAMALGVVVTAARIMFGAT
jgi:hypothetical protein